MPKKQLSHGLFAIFVTLGLLMLIFVFSFFPATRKPFEFFAKPVMKTFYSFGGWIQSIPNPFLSSFNLQKKNMQLENDIERLQRENDELRTKIGQAKLSIDAKSFLDSIQREGIIGHIIGKTFTERKVLFIDVGTDQKIQIGYPVITELGFLVGRVTSVTSTTARVTLITDPQSTIGTKIQNEQSSPGVTKGSYGLAMTMDLIPQDDTVSVHQSVVTSAIDSFIPPNISVGSISEIHKITGSVFQQAQIVSPVSFDRLESLIIILPKT